MPTDPQEITWTGDLDDDCCARVGPFVAHVEAMDDDLWFVGVYRDDADDPLYHSAETGVWPSTGPAARELAEKVLREAMAGEPEPAREDSP